MNPMQFFSEKRVMADIAGISSRTRWLATPKITEAARYMVQRLQNTPGLMGVQVIELPADGKTAYGGWVMPKAWDVKNATLTLAAGQQPGGCPRVLADYRENPFTQMLWSAPTPPRGIEAEVVPVDDPFRKGLNIKGKFALVGTLDQASTKTLAAVARAGAVGLICDRVIPKPGSKEGAYLDDAVQYWNYTNPQWDHERRLPAFGITPNTGRKLRALIASQGRVRLHARVDSRLYDGTFPLVTARLPGRHVDEYVLTAHMDEPGASDNASGTALAMETLRALAEYAHARKEPLYHGIRLYCSVEARGLQALLNTKRPPRKIIGGLNLDMLAYDHNTGRTRLDIYQATPENPSAADILLCERAEREARRKPDFRWRHRPALIVNDCHFAGHPYNAPMLCLGQAPDKTYHSSLDTVENLSAPHVRRIGRIVVESVHAIACPSLHEFTRIGKVALAQAAAELKDRKSKRQPAAIIAHAQKIWANLVSLMPESALFAKPRPKQSRGKPLPRYLLEAQAREWQRALLRIKPAPRALSRPKRVPAAPRKKAQALVPLKLFSGYIAFEDLNAAQQKRLLQRTGLAPGWGGPGWLQTALDLSNGKRTLWELYQAVSPLHTLDLKQFAATFDFLKERGQVRYRPVLKKSDLIEAVRRVGIQRGDIVMAHSSLSDFGYIEGGAEALIEALLEVAGPAGTVCMPTHSLNWNGKEPYDPRTSPSFTGAVPAAFMKRGNALRSGHPTHSVAAIGRDARRLTDGDDGTKAPQGRDGFWGRFVDAGGKVLMMCKLSSNTLLHAGELWAGTPYPPALTHALRNGRRVETLTPGMPWHVHTFEAVHERLRARGQLRSRALGESRIHAMDAREAVREMMDYIRENPRVAIREKCSCGYCVYLAQRLAGSHKAAAAAPARKPVRKPARKPARKLVRKLVRA